MTCSSTPLSTSHSGACSKALFLDRDGVINVNHGYVYKSEDCDFIEGIFDLCRAAQSRGYLIIIVTNQSGIARDYYTQAQFKQFSKWIEQRFYQQGVKIQHTYHCPHHPQQTGVFGRTCLCRKPKHGMVVSASKQFKVNRAKSIMVGDSKSDITCALRANIGKVVHFLPDRKKHGSAHAIYPSLYRVRNQKYYRARTLRSIERLL